jgi:hypothetical protein
MQYHLSIPSTALAYTAVQIAEMAKMMNAEIAKVAGEVNPRRLQVVAPPHFNVGIDLAPVYPSKFSCSRFDTGIHPSATGYTQMASQVPAPQ